MLALTNYMLLKLHSDVLQHLLSLWYCCNVMTNKIFQSIGHLQPIFKDLSLWLSSEDFITKEYI